MSNLSLRLLAILVGVALVSSACFQAEEYQPHKITRANSSPLSLSSNDLTVHTFTGISSPRAITYDGVNLWIANIGMNTVTEISEDGVVLGTYNVGNSPKAVEFDGKDIWVANNGEGSVDKLNLQGEVIGTYPIGGGYTAPTSLLYHLGHNTLEKPESENLLLCLVFPSKQEHQDLVY